MPHAWIEGADAGCFGYEFWRLYDQSHYKEQIQEVIACYGKAAARAVEAGYDCLEFHLAHNYLPHSFLSAGFNHREDEYGGSFENRCRFPLEVIDEIRKNMPEGMPLCIRIDAQDDMLENGLTIEDVIRFCKIAKSMALMF